jgi:hypothetical protein
MNMKRNRLTHLAGLMPTALVIALLTTALPAFATGPALNLPANNSSASVTLPYFDWSDFVASPFVGSYEIQIDDTLNFSSPVATATLPAVVSFYSPHAELAQGTYYWRERSLRDRRGRHGRLGGDQDEAPAGSRP